MASITGSSVSLKSTAQVRLPTSWKSSKNYALKSTVSVWKARPTVPRLRVSCAAAPETVEKVSNIVKEQLALKEDTAVTGETKFAEIGADSLDTVEIVMKLEEEFGVSVEEADAQSIATIQQAADMIEKLQKK